MLPAIIVIAVLVALVVAPQIWVSRVLKRHKAERPDLPGTGGELARHLIAHYGIEGASVERFDGPDHYAPDDRAVRLSPDIHDGRSLSAVAVAAHEVGHAIQHHRNERGLALTGKLMRVVAVTDKFAGVFFLLSAPLSLLARTPAAFFAFVGLGIVFLGLRVVARAATLPVEYDASFGKALPILEAGGYLHADDIAPVRSVLKAAALTYVAGALMGLVDLVRWARILF